MEDNIKTTMFRPELQQISKLSERKFNYMN